MPELVNIRQIESGTHINQAQVAGPEVVVPVAGKTNVGQPGRGCGAEAAEGVVAAGAAGHYRAGGGGGQAGGAEMIAVQVVERIIAAAHHLHAQGHRLPGNGIGDAAGGSGTVDLLLVAGEGIVAGFAPRVHRLHPDTGGIIGEAGCLAADRYAAQLIFHVEVLRVSDAAFHPFAHIAVVVVAVIVVADLFDGLGLGMGRLRATATVPRNIVVGRIVAEVGDVAYLVVLEIGSGRIVCRHRPGLPFVPSVRAIQ